MTVSDSLIDFAPVGLEEIEAVSLMNRTDTKYVMSLHLLPEFLRRMDGCYNVLEINGSRVFSYSNTYLDTTGFDFFIQHVTQRPGRSKVRFRTYLNTGNTFLEVKKKTVKNRTIKWRIENRLTNDFNFDGEAVQFIGSHICGRQLSLYPVINNDFHRITFARKDSGERLTIDFDLSFSHNGTERFDLNGLTVIELKRDCSSVRSKAASILRELSVHPSGFSKYCVGISALYNVPKKSLYKSKLISINKIENEYINNTCFSNNRVWRG